MEASRRPYEDYAYVIEFLPYGHPLDTKPAYMKEPILHVVGDQLFTLLECVPKLGISFLPRERVYIGKEQRTNIERVRRRISYDDLTTAGKAELPVVVEEIVEKNIAKLVQFFNEARPLTVRMHQLELLPTIGKKTMWTILEERKRQPFENLEDVEQRIGVSNVKKIMTDRVMKELRGSERFYILVRPPR